MPWAYEDINVEGLGMVRLTGDLTKVMASVPEGENLLWQGKPFRCHAAWLLREGALDQTDSWMLGKGREGGLSDAEATKVRDLLEDAVTEWTSDPQAQSMLAANTAQVRLSDAEVDSMRVRRDALRKSADGIDPYATMDALREVGELTVRLRAVDVDKALRGESA